MRNRIKSLSILQTQTFFLSSDSACKKVTEFACNYFELLRIDQEEADTKVILHTLHALEEDNQRSVVLCSPSGDTDIMVIALGLINKKDRVYFDNGSGNNRKSLWLKDLGVSEDHCAELIGFHAFTGNYYISAFFRKGKKVCWNTTIKKEKFRKAFASLGEEWNLTNETKQVIKEYVNLYGSKKVSVNEARLEILKKYAVQNKIVDLSVLPPCHSSIVLHT